jgi:hypothetical protein
MNDNSRTIERPRNSGTGLFHRSIPPIASLVAVTGFALVGVVATTAEAQANTSSGSTTANVTVGSTITLSNLTPAFTLTGNPGDTPSAQVTMTVTTNNFAGYTVTVQAASPTLAPSIPGSTASIPIGDLDVRETTVGTYGPMSSITPVQVHSQPAASAADGDTVSNDYQMTIPFVRPDTYTGTLDYIATTL